MNEMRATRLSTLCVLHFTWMDAWRLSLSYYRRCCSNNFKSQNISLPCGATLIIFPYFLLPPSLLPKKNVWNQMPPATQTSIIRALDSIRLVAWMVCSSFVRFIDQLPLISTWFPFLCSEFLAYTSPFSPRAVLRQQQQQRCSNNDTRTAPQCTNKCNNKKERKWWCLKGLWGMFSIDSDARAQCNVVNGVHGSSRGENRQTVAFVIDSRIE